MLFWFEFIADQLNPQWSKYNFTQNINLLWNDFRQQRILLQSCQRPVWLVALQIHRAFQVPSRARPSVRTRRIVVRGATLAGPSGTKRMSDRATHLWKEKNYVSGLLKEPRNYISTFWFQGPQLDIGLRQSCRFGGELWRRFSKSLVRWCTYGLRSARVLFSC